MIDKQENERLSTKYFPLHASYVNAAPVITPVNPVTWRWR